MATLDAISLHWVCLETLLMKYLDTLSVKSAGSGGNHVISALGRWRKEDNFHTILGYKRDPFKF